MNKIFFCSLKSKKDIGNIFLEKNVVSNKIYLFRYRYNDIKKLRYAFSTKKNIFKTAVIRNKIKRQLRMIMNGIEKIKNIDILIIVKQEYNINE
jgi:ribonuclease P protein component